MDKMGVLPEIVTPEKGIYMLQKKSVTMTRDSVKL